MELILRITFLEDNLKLTKNEFNPFLRLSYSRCLDFNGNIWNIPVLDRGRWIDINTKIERCDDIVPIRCGIAISLFSNLSINDKYHRYEQIGGCFLNLNNFLTDKRQKIHVIDHSEYNFDFIRLKLMIELVKMDCKTIKFVGSNRNYQKIFDEILDRYENTYDDVLYPTKKKYKRMHIKRHALQCGGLKIPASTFCMNIRTTGDVEMIAYLVRLACDMNDLKEEDMIQSLKNQLESKGTRYDDGLNMTSKIICEGLCLFSNACDYVPDLSSNNDVERFMDSFQCLCGDCEV